MTCGINNLKIDWSFVFSPNVSLCGWLGSKHQLTNWLTPVWNVPCSFLAGIFATSVPALLAERSNLFWRGFLLVYIIRSRLLVGLAQCLAIFVWCVCVRACVRSCVCRCSIWVAQPWFSELLSCCFRCVNKEIPVWWSNNGIVPVWFSVSVCRFGADIEKTKYVELLCCCY